MLPDVYLYLGADNTPTECIRRCREEGEGYAYAGVQSAEECFCGNAPPPSDIIVDDNQCNHGCGGNQDLICGGHWRMNVYETGKGSIQKFKIMRKSKFQQVAAAAAGSIIGAFRDFHPNSVPHYHL